MNLTSGSTGQAEGSIAQSLECSDVRLSAAGLAATVAFNMDSISSEPLPGSNEPIRHHLTFERKIELELGKPTKITQEMHRIPLRKGDPLPPAEQPGPPQISVTATEI